MATSNLLDENALMRNITVGVICLIVINAVLILLLAPSFAISAIIRGVVRIVFAIMMFKGVNWARWIFALGGVATFVLNIISFIGFNKAGYSMLSIIGIWIILDGLIELGIAGVLIFSVRVNKFFGT